MCSEYILTNLDPIFNGEDSHAMFTNNVSSVMTSSSGSRGNIQKNFSGDDLDFSINKELVDILIRIVRSPKIGK